MQRGCSSESVQMQNEAKNETNDEIASLKKQINMLKAKKNDYKHKYQQTLEELNDYKKANQNLESLHSDYPYLFLHIRSLNIDEENENSIVVYVCLLMTGNNQTT